MLNNSKILDFGSLAINEIRTIQLKILNNNPIPIHIYSIDYSFSFIKIMLESIRSETGQVIQEKKAINKRGSKKRPLFTLKSNSEALFLFVLSALN